MINEILEHMTPDELRNYAVHCQELLEAEDQLNFAQQQLLKDWRQMINDTEFQRDSVAKRNSRFERFKRIEDKMYEKYNQYLPRPVCDSMGTPEDVDD